jgi:glycosyltransferase involved in cell wall biosynthesis
MVSVIIPSYNRAWSIERAIDSILSQTVKEFEIIVVNDGSSDGTKQLLTCKYPAVRQYTINHSGVSRARNVGVQNARGEWIAFLDSDDYWLPNKLEEQMSYLTMNPCFKICHTDEIWIKNGKRINQSKKHQKYSGWFFSPSLQLCLISPSSVIIKKTVFDDVGMFDENFEYVEDYELWLRITAFYPVGYINKKLIVKTGGHEDQLSKRIDGIEGHRIQALEKLLETVQLREEYYKEALAVYRRKYQIYRNGCMKRGKGDEVKKLEEKMEKLNFLRNSS